MQHYALQHLAHLGGGQRGNNARALGGLKCDGLRGVLRGDRAGDNARRNAECPSHVIDKVEAITASILR